MNTTDDGYPDYSSGEKVADGIVHLLGVIAAIVGATALIIWAAIGATGGEIAAVSIYGTGLILTFVASALYHMTPWERLRPIFRRVDHAAIFVMIAGTYTPFVVMLGTTSSYIVLAAIWSIAAIGVVRKLFFWQVQGWGGVLLYLAMGWMGIGVIWTLFGLLPVLASAMIVAGGLLYTVGVVFYRWEALKFSNAIWHGFVLAASACFYIAITLGVGQVAV
ncbi:PAQR family membrane homeostasis protein TrhA [Pontivivens insulae]|uniref:Hemolysin-III related n=1 Tax=Pontivivens insulae TaxID=1639689 RepID=A0A2R8AD87_9RHOB|nr:hemolysin III family protein [Pontivivens insulae]RED14151.1 channel protein (hemolysin III family) [Pontivivens insulae]SPF30227.1 hypothetical protein POI8812_02562 [Pontivivens insulae]